MNKLPAAIFASCALCWPFNAFATDAPPRAKPEAVGMSSERLALIRQRIDAEIARDKLPGGVLAIVRRGKLVHFETYGYLDKAEWKASMKGGASTAPAPQSEPVPPTDPSMPQATDPSSTPQPDTETPRQ